MNFLSYIQGKRYGEEAYRLEKEAMRDPFLQDAIDGYDLVNDHPSYHLKKLEKYLSTRTKRKSHALQKWGIAAAVLLIISLSILFFLTNRANMLKDTIFIENHVDRIISNYKNDSLQYVKDSLNNLEQNIVDNQTIKQDKLIQPAQPTQSVQPVQPVQPIQPTQSIQSPQTTQPVQPEETEKFKENKEDVQNSPLETPSQYNPPNEEIEEQTAPIPAKGNEAYNSYIEQNRRQIKDANYENQHGKVILMFHVNKQGRPVDIAILRALCPEADKEAIRILQNGPDWTFSEMTARLEVNF